MPSVLSVIKACYTIKRKFGEVNYDCADINNHFAGENQEKLIL